MNNYYFIDKCLRKDRKMSNDEELQELRSENKRLSLQLETAQRELAESVRNEVDLSYEVQSLINKLATFKKGD